MRMQEFNVAVEQEPAAEKTKGGIILTPQTQEKDKHRAQVGRIVAMSPMAFSFADWPDGEPKPEVGDRVVFAPHAGMFFDEAGENVRIMKDKDIVAVLE